MLLVTLAAAGFSAFILWPNGDYRPIQPGEKGTLAGGFRALADVPSGRPGLTEARAAELDGAPAVACRLGPVTRRLGGQWLGVPVHGLDELAAVVFEATEELVPVTHPQPFQADLVLARGRVPGELAGRPLTGSWTARSVSLVADRSAPGVPRFEDLAAFPLEGPGPG
jgi:hypothetical protein